MEQQHNTTTTPPPPQLPQQHSLSSSQSTLPNDNQSLTLLVQNPIDSSPNHPTSTHHTASLTSIHPDPPESPSPHHQSSSPTHSPPPSTPPPNHQPPPIQTNGKHSTSPVLSPTPTLPTDPLPLSPPRTAPSFQYASSPQTMPARSRRQLGEYTLGKTLGAGSMGKVKLAVSSMTGEQIAIKIIPRHTSISAAQQQLEKERNQNQPSSSSSRAKDHASVAPSPSFIEKAKNKDISKEIRTIREASIVLLLHHPYVCGMKSMLVYPHHYYMLFEYVNGGQLLDYIISHGRLRERAARKFARQMGSALEYCHANSIVHRDLKIENILISKTGNIKIIDFGLSNLYSPNSNLQTFCGSLYFAAPELLNAKVYIGPEIDVWSFGIVLYVLVCGKVPFDDQSMPALHAKIKRGQVDYPTWLSSECKHILCRMLVLNPSNRATLQEVLNHPWMLKGYEGPPDPHIPHREPLRLNQIEPEVIKGMTGFEFGSAEKIEADLREVLSSEMYNKVLKLYDEKRANNPNLALESVYNTLHSGSSTSMSPMSGNKRDTRTDRDPSKTPNKSNKRFSGFGFYGKKMAGGLAAVLNTVGAAKNDDKFNSDSNSTISNGFESVLLNGQTLDSLDPTRGFHPLISIYFLVREKIERERIYGPGVFASSTLSITGPPPPPAPPSAYKTGLVQQGTSREKAFSPTHETPSGAPTRLSNKNRNTLTGTKFDGDQRDQTAHLLELHQNGKAQRFVRPNTATERMVSTPLPSAPNSPSHTTDFAQGRVRNTQSLDPSKRRSVHVMTAPESSGVLQVVTDVLPPHPQRAGLGISGTTTGRPERVLSMVEPGSAPLTGPSDTERSPSSGFARRFGSFLGRSASVNDPDYKRHRPRSSIGLGHKLSSKTPLKALPQVTETAGLSPPFSPGGLQDQQLTSPVSGQDERSEVSAETQPLSAPIQSQTTTATPTTRAAAVRAKSDLDTNVSSRSRHHHRGSSAGAELMLDVPSPHGEDKPPPPSSSNGSSWRPRLTSFQGKGKRPASPVTAPTNVLSESEGDTNPLDEDGEGHPLESGSPESSLPKQLAPQVSFSGRTAPPSAKLSDKTKPIYLKGLFSVATTSTRGPQVLRTDLVTVLNRIGFQHREIKGGFECAHVPSIDPSIIQGSSGINTAGNLNLPIPTNQPNHGGSGKSSSKKVESMKKKVSKASFNNNKNSNNENKIVKPGNNSSNISNEARSEPSLTDNTLSIPDTPRQGTIPSVTIAEGNPKTSNANTNINPPTTTTTTTPTTTSTTTTTPNPNNKMMDSVGMSNNKKYDLIVRFEIFIVKMPLLPGICGLQFRRISGNAWQYQTFARRILQELKL